jgi:hypothetical protein
MPILTKLREFHTGDAKPVDEPEAPGRHGEVHRADAESGAWWLCESAGAARLLPGVELCRERLQGTGQCLRLGQGRSRLDVERRNDAVSWRRYPSGENRPWSSGVPFLLTAPWMTGPLSRPRQQTRR